MPRDYKHNCPCAGHPFECFGHPTTCPCANDVDYTTQLRLLSKYRVRQGETIGQILARVDRSRREDLSKMLEAWQFWGDLGPEFQSELLDCIEHTYRQS